MMHKPLTTVNNLMLWQQQQEYIVNYYDTVLKPGNFLWLSLYHGLRHGIIRAGVGSRPQAQLVVGAS